MTALLGRVRKLEAIHGGAVTDVEFDAAEALLTRHFWVAMAQAKLWPAPAVAEVEAMRAAEERGDIERARGIRRAHWEQRNPGRSYEAHVAEQNARAEEDLRQLEKDHAEAIARAEEQERADAEWAARKALDEGEAVGLPEKRPVPSIPAALR